MSGVFISYRRSDSRGSAGRIYDNLEDRLGRDQVFRDIDALEPGAEYEGAIEAFIGSCDAVVAVIGNEWLEARDEAGQRRIDDPADLVRREIEAALVQGKLVIPVLVEDAVMPKAGELPGRLAGLAARNALPISDARWDYDVGRLVQALERALAPDAHAEGARRPAPEPVASARRLDPASPGPTPAPGSSTRARTIALVAVGVLALLVAVVLLGGGSGDGSDPTEPARPEETQEADAEEASEAPEPTVSLSTTSASPGTEIAVSGSGFDPGETISISVGDEVLTEATADDEGAFEDATFVVPADAESAEYQIDATGAESGLSATEWFEVP